MESMRKPISERVSQPTSAEIRQAREQSGLTQKEAASLVSSAEKAGYKTWAGYETEPGQTKSNHRAIPLAVWELFLLLTDQHPFFKILESTKGNKDAYS